MTAETIQEERPGEPWHGLIAYRVRQELDLVCALYGCPGIEHDALRIWAGAEPTLAIGFTHEGESLHVIVPTAGLVADPDRVGLDIVSDLVCALRELHHNDVMPEQRHPPFVQTSPPWQATPWWHEPLASPVLSAIVVAACGAAVALGWYLAPSIHAAVQAFR